MKKILFILSFCLSFSSFAQSLEFYLGAKRIKTLSVQAIEKNKKFKTHDHVIYNPFRKEKKNYYGTDLILLLNSVYGNAWKKAGVIKFVALDGFVAQAPVDKMLEKSQSHQGILAIGENGKIGFADFDKKGKMINPGPFQVTWIGLDENTVADFNDVLKWPYQLKSIIVSPK